MNRNIGIEIFSEDHIKEVKRICEIGEKKRKLLKQDNNNVNIKKDKRTSF